MRLLLIFCSLFFLTASAFANDYCPQWIIAKCKSQYSCTITTAATGLHPLSSNSMVYTRGTGIFLLQLNSVTVDRDTWQPGCSYSNNDNSIGAELVYTGNYPIVPNRNWTQMEDFWACPSDSKTSKIDTTDCPFI